MPKNHIDSCFYSFTEPVEAKGDLRALLPSQIVAAADWGTCEALPAGLVPPRRKAHVADRIFRVRLGRTQVWVYLLLVRAHAEDRMLALDLLRGIVGIQERYVRENPGTRSLPAVIPVALYHGDRRWQGEPRFSALYDPEMKKVLGDLALDSEFLVHEAMERR